MIPQLRQSTNHILPYCRQELCIVLGRSSCSNGARFSQAISNLPRHFSHLSKQDIANIVAEEHGLSMAKSRRILDTILDTIVENVSQKKSVRLSSFGSFSSVYAKERPGTNPYSGQPILIPAKQRVKFRPYNSFKENANK
mmetsp:Transcript_24217/g.36124  ORF Transcript_24217/g.36124 Transcript_24217/m.36124 type:complete len:140 (-) Transcript_24217:392-811(-)